MLAVALALAAAGCGGGSHPPVTTRVTTRASAAGPPKCTLSAKQRRVVRRGNQMILEMHRLEQPLKTVHEHGPRKLELLLNRFLLTIGILPVDDRALLIRKAKSATGLCEDCFQALEAVEPAVETLGGHPCKPGF